MIIKRKLYSLSHTIEVVPFSQDIIDEFKGSGSMLKHCKWTPEMDGLALMKGGSDLAGYVIWSTKDKEIKGLEVMKDYRRQGLGEELLGLANENGIRTLTVNRNNKPALDLYTKCGYKPVRESGAMIWMEKL